MFCHELILAPHECSMHTTDSNRRIILPIASVQLGPLSTISFKVSQEVELLHCATQRENTMRGHLQHVPSWSLSCAQCTKTSFLQAHVHRGEHRQRW